MASVETFREITLQSFSKIQHKKIDLTLESTPEFATDTEYQRNVDASPGKRDKLYIPLPSNHFAQNVANTVWYRGTSNKDADKLSLPFC